MKHANTVVFVIVAAAVLLTAYGVGLLIRQARMSHVEPDRQTVAAPNDTAPSEAMAEDYGPGRGRRQRSVDEDPAKVKQQRAEMLEKMSNLTEEEQEQFRQQVRRRFSSSGSGNPAVDLEREKRQQMFQKWQTMSEEEKQALRAQMEARLRARRQRELAGRPGEITDANTTTDPEGDGRTAEPNEAGQS